MGSFLLLLWKNWKLQSRKPTLTFFEIFLPVLFAALLLLIRQVVDVTKYDTYRYWNNFEIKDLVRYV